ncbi:MAG: DUF6152 family protein [Proteobacteria bacterium]|nr:DUF6152 family protein [Pseudomonadota bacterium]
MAIRMFGSTNRLSLTCWILAGLWLATGTSTVQAHHAFAAEFDSTKPVKLRGKITKMEWVNPHAWMHMQVIDEDGNAQDWMIEAGPPGALVRRGWTKTSVKPGTEILVEGYQATDGALRANGRDVTFPDGRRLFAGSSGTGAPLDGADPDEKSSSD